MMRHDNVCGVWCQQSVKSNELATASSASDSIDVYETLEVPLCMCVRHLRSLPSSLLSLILHASLSHGVASISRLLQIIGLFCKRAL